MTFVRGDIHWVSFPNREPRGAEIEKDRPCIIVSHREASLYRKTVVVVPLTNGGKDAPPIIISIVSGGRDSKAICDQIVAVDKTAPRRSEWAGRGSRSNAVIPAKAGIQGA